MDAEHAIKDSFVSPGGVDAQFAECFKTSRHMKKETNKLHEWEMETRLFSCCLQKNDTVRRFPKKDVASSARSHEIKRSLTEVQTARIYLLVKDHFAIVWSLQDCHGPFYLFL